MTAITLQHAAPTQPSGPRPTTSVLSIPGRALPKRPRDPSPTPTPEADAPALTTFLAHVKAALSFSGWPAVYDTLVALNHQHDQHPGSRADAAG